MADTKVSALPAATAAAGANEVPINEAGTSKKVTVTQLRDFVVYNQPQVPGSFTIPTGMFSILLGTLTLTGSQRLTIAGSGRLAVI